MTQGWSSAGSNPAELCSTYTIVKERIISLGAKCIVAHFLIDYCLDRFCSSPFDWVLACDMAMVTKLLSTNFDGFFEPDSLQVLGARVRDRRTSLVSFHDFDAQDIQLAEYPQVIAKYRHKIDNVYRAINSGNPVTFMRLGRDWRQIREFDRWVREAYPRLDYRLVVLHESLRIKLVFNMGRICVYEVPVAIQPYPEPVKEAWKMVFEDCGLLDKTCP
jgi:hypothetical protein